MKEYSERVKTLIDKMKDSSSSELFSIVERELNTRITAVTANKKIYGDKLYNCKIKIEDVVLCSEYNVLRANYNYLVFAINLIKEKIMLEKMTQLYKSVVSSAVDGLTLNELKGVDAVLSEISVDSAIIVIGNIARKWGITRSLIISGLKKLECAGIIEMYSMGVKGTSIKILYSDIKSVIEKKRGNEIE